MQNVEVEEHYEDDLPPIKAEFKQIQQVLLNLFINAAHAMDKGGSLTVSARKTGKDGFVAVEDADTGCGIPEENLSKIFDPFFTTKETGKGTGLGLSTSYGIIKENGGNISIKETSPGGTTFLLELPLYVPSDDDEHI